MYTREQASQLRQAFWTAFGQYMTPVLSVEGLKANWLNYNTGFKHLYFRMKADKKVATIGIEITHPDLEIQDFFMEQFVALKNVLHETVAEEWIWQSHVPDENDKIISRIYQEITPVNVFNRDDWPALISFFKPRIIALDTFWSDAQYAFEDLR